MRATVTNAVVRSVRAFWGDEGWGEPALDADGAGGRASSREGAQAGGRRLERSLPAQRPSVPPLLYVSAAMWASLLCASCAISPGSLPFELGDRALAGIEALTAVGAAAFSAAAWRGHARVLSLVAIGALLGMALALSSELALRADERALDAESAGSHAFTAVSDASPSDFGASVTARMELAGGGSVRVRVLLDEDGVRCGERFRTSVALQEASPEVAARLRAQGVVGSVSAYAPVEPLEREWPPRALIEARSRAVALFDGFSGEGPALCKAVLLGDRADLSRNESFYADVKSVGLAHLVAVSGSHLTMVAAMVEGVLRALRAPRWARAVAVGAFVAVYVVLTGMPISAVRAAVMSLVALAAPLSRRRSGGLSAIAVCSFALLAADPTCASSLSLQLSVVSTLGIVAFMPLVRSWIGRAAPALPAPLAEATSMTLSASALTLPLTIPAFSQVPLVSPLANVLAAPVFSALCCGGLLAVVASLALPAIAPAALAPIVWLAQAFAEGVELLAGVPFAAVPAAAEPVPSALVGAALCVVAWVAWPQPSARTLRAALALGCALFAAASFALPRFSGDEVVMLDVGQGDAFLVRSEGATLLVDTGISESLLLEGLAHEGVARLDAVLVTHPDADHCEALSALRSTVPVGKVLVAQDCLACGCDNCARLRASAERAAPGALCGLAVGDRLRVGAFALRVIGPDAYQDEGGNADSVCFVLEHGSTADGSAAWTALFCGDAEAETLRGYVEEGRVGDVDLLKVAHHGARAGLDEKLAAVLDPEIALVSVGAGNPYGHPSSEVLSLLETAGAAVFRTDEDGAVTCRFAQDAIDVTCESA